MRRDHHVGRLAFQGLVDDAGVVLRQAGGVEPALARLLQFCRRAQIGRRGIVELQVTATGVIKSANGLPVGFCQIVKDSAAIGINSESDGVPLRRKCSVAGFGMHIFGMTRVCALRNLKCSSIG